MKRVLVVRQDNNGDVLLTGPAVRAVARAADSVTFACGPRGEAAARLLPGVAETMVWESPWIDQDPHPVSAPHVDAFVKRLRRKAFDEAIVFTSFHQSPLPMALLLRLAGIGRIGAISVDYAGSLLDVRHRVEDDIHEVQRALSLTAAMGYWPAPDDALQLRIRDVGKAPARRLQPYVVVHPGATMAARAWSERGNAALVALLARRGHRVVVTGARQERALADRVVGSTRGAENFAGKTTFAQFAAIVAGASGVVSGNTVAPHLAAAFGTPVVSIFPPTIPAVRFRPWMVDHVLLGNQTISCAGCRARVCPIEGQPCLAGVTPRTVADALESLLGRATAKAVS
jgi:ADP-heptose:LPS heptosyltransferase